MIYSVLKELENYRDEVDNEFQHWYDFAVRICKDVGIYILPVHKLLCTRRCLQCTIVHTKIVYSCRRRALEQKCQQKHPFARLHTKYR